LFKILNDKKYIFNTTYSRHTLFFRASTSCSKVLNVKTIFNAMKIFRASSVFQGKGKLFKILKDKNTFNTVNSGNIWRPEGGATIEKWSPLDGAHE